jgi:hypothetical protein
MVLGLLTLLLMLNKLKALPLDIIWLRMANTIRSKLTTQRLQGILVSILETFGITLNHFISYSDYYQSYYSQQGRGGGGNNNGR